MPWDLTLENQAHGLVERICGDGTAAVRDRAWRDLLALIAPSIEHWARTSAALRRVGLTGEDEARAVLVNVIERACRKDFANLRSYLARQAPDPEEAADTASVEELTRATGEPGETADEAVTGTPLRGWLLALTRFVIKEHVLQRFGWRSVARWSIELATVPAGLLEALRALPGVTRVEHAGGTLVVDHRPAQLRAAELAAACAAHGIATSPQVVLDKRGVGSGAERLELVPERGERPPLSTLLGVREALAEIRAYAETFPPPMRRALALWLEDTPLEQIAGELSLPAAEARALIRAATARLRDKFRGAWPELFGDPS